jgi:hypothetical protein
MVIERETRTVAGFPPLSEVLAFATQQKWGWFRTQEYYERFAAPDGSRKCGFETLANAIVIAVAMTASAAVRAVESHHSPHD